MSYRIQGGLEFLIGAACWIRLSPDLNVFRFKHNIVVLDKYISTVNVILLHLGLLFIEHIHHFGDLVTRLRQVHLRAHSQNPLRLFLSIVAGGGK